MITPVVQQYLATIYVMASEGQTVIGARLAERLGVKAPTVTETLRRLLQEGYVTWGDRKEIRLTEAGRAVAESAVRRHRVVERWLTDALGLDWADAHEVAHRLEHAVTPEVVDRLLTALGRPTTCPHGNPIPGTGGDQPLAVTLDQAPVGETVVVDRVTEDGVDVREFLRYVGQLGIKPGVRLQVAERAPWAGTITLRQGDRTVVVGQEAGRRIWVRPAPVEPSAAEPQALDDPEVLVTVQAVHGLCRAGHRSGEQFALGCRTPAGLCSEAFQALFPIAEGLRVQAEMGNEQTAVEVPCPEDGSVVFRMEVRSPHRSTSDD
ncbi:MAG TPA: iron dependent repressor, metal binding and dimerization domain protein [Chloroflexota bacterium]